MDVDVGEGRSRLALSFDTFLDGLEVRQKKVCKMLCAPYRNPLMLFLRPRKPSSDRVLDGFLRLLDAHPEPFVLRSDAQASMVVHQAPLEVSQIVQCFRLLVDGLGEVLVLRQSRFGVLQPVVWLSQEDVAFASGHQGVLVHRV